MSVSQKFLLDENMMSAGASDGEYMVWFIVHLVVYASVCGFYGRLLLRFSLFGFLGDCLSWGEGVSVLWCFEYFGVLSGI